MSAEPAKEWGVVPIPKIVKEDQFQLPPIISVADFLHQDLPMPEVLVEGLIRKRSVVMFASGSKSYKTWGLLHLALCVERGVPWLDRRVTQGRVLYLNFELTAAELQSRLKAIKDEMELPLDEPVDDINFDICNMRGCAADISRIMPELIKHCEGKDYALIIPDPIYSMMGERNENAANEMADFLNHLSKLSEATGAAVIYTHHFAKGLASSKEQIDRASGSGVFARHADGIITMTRHKEENAFTVEAELRSFKRPEPFAIRWKYPTMRPANDLNPRDLKNRAGRPPKYEVQHILDCLTDQGLTSTQWKTAAKDKHGMGPTTFHELCRKAQAAGRIEQREGKWFRVPTPTHLKLVVPDPPMVLPKVAEAAVQEGSGV